MPNLNENYLKLQENYLFSEIAHRVAAYTKQHPEKNVIRLGIGDVTRPLCQCAGEALLEGAKEMMSADTFGLLQKKWCRDRCVCRICVRRGKE